MVCVIIIGLKPLNLWLCRVNVLVGVDVLLEPNSTSAFVAARISAGGCDVGGASGIFFWISVMGTWEVTSDIGL